MYNNLISLGYLNYNWQTHVLSRYLNYNWQTHVINGWKMLEVGL